MSMRVSYKKQIVFLLLLSLIFLAIVEAAANIWWFDQTKCAFETNELYENFNADFLKQLCVDQYGLAMNSNFIIPSQEFETMTINSHGFRGTEFDIIKPENTYRIFFIGGSTAFGSGATSDETTIAGYLQKRIDELDLSYAVEVINAGKNGGNSLNEKKLIIEKIFPLSPNLLIVFDGWNDIRSDYSKELTKNNWEEMCIFGQTTGIDVIIILQPNLSFGNKPLTEQEKSWKMKASDHYGKKLTAKVEHYNQYAGALQELENTCTKTYDFRYVFDDTYEPIYWDDGHMGDRGNKIIANNLFKKLDTHLINYTFVSDTKKLNTDFLDNSNLRKIDAIYNDSNKITKNFFDLKPIKKLLLIFTNSFSFYKTPAMLDDVLNFS